MFWLVALILLLTIMLGGCAGEPEGNGGDVRNGGDSSESGESTGSSDDPETTGISRKPPTTENETTRTGQSRRDQQRATDGEMSLSDAVGQMFLVATNGTQPNYYIEKMIRERNIGGVLLHGSNMESKAQTQQLVGSLQELSLETDPAVPLFIAVDEEGGRISSAPWVSPQPSAAQVGDSGDPETARNIAETIGRELRQAGVNTDLAPVVDTGAGAAIGDRSFGNDPELVSQMAAASVLGFEDAGVVTSAKHFPNHGPARVDSHSGQPTIDHDMQRLRSYDLPPFQAAVDTGVPMLMTGHLTYPAIDPESPASLSPEATEMIRDELNFDGVIITDDLSMQGATRGGTTPEAAVRAVKAGADMMIVSDVPEVQAASYQAVLEAVEDGEIPREQVYESVQRLMEVKGEYGLYEDG